VKRREFITLLGGAAAWPLVAGAQQGSAMRRLGVLVHGSQSNAEWQHRIAAFQKGLEELGWMEGRNIRVEWQFSENDFDRLPHLAQALVASNPEVIFVNTTPATRALQQMTRTIPIVFAQVSDPVGAGLVASLARPGANFTGFLYYEDSIAGKWLGMLKEIAPHLTRAGLLGNPKGFPYGYFLRTASVIAPSLGIEIIPAPIASADDINRSLEFFARDANGGLLCPPDNTVDGHRDLVISLTKRHHLPAVYAFRSFVVAGGLMSYGVDDDAHFRHAASYVDRILRGAKPADLPVQTPIKYATVVNLKTAKAMGLDVPPTLLVRADEVIE
jgi:putative tryptophan/tyrosine transport system substrate-binding protein